MTAKHTIPTLFVACAGLCLAVLPLSAATFGNFTYTDDGTSITITGYPSTEIGAVVIPDAITGKPVTRIGVDAFQICSGLTSVTIPSSITSIGDFAFYYCSGLISVTIPSSVTSIGHGAFDACSGLTAITIDPANPNYSSLSGTVFNKEQTVLLRCPHGTQGNYSIPSSVTGIGYHAFSSCNGLTSVTVPSSLTSIAESMFDGCIGLTSVKIPSSVTSIGNGAFAGCIGLTNLAIPASVTVIGEYAFYDCSGLTSVTIPFRVTSIGDYAFGHCYGLTIAKFSGVAPTMGAGVFYAAASGFTINYIKGKTGFTSPTWNGYPCVGIAATPEIDVQQPLGTSLVDGTAKKSFGTVAVGQSGGTKNFTIVNTGTANLTSLAIMVDGANAGDFTIAPLAKTTLAPGGKTTFKVTLQPTASGTRSAAIHITSNDANENPFDIQVAGAGS